MKLLEIVGDADYEDKGRDGFDMQSAISID